MTATVEDPSSLPGEVVSDQEGRRVGKIEALYVERDGGEPQWVTVDAGVGLFSRRTLMIPLARLKDEDGKLLVPYSKRHILDCPEVDAEKELSSEDERRLRDHYGIDRGDQEQRNENDSYASRDLPEEAEGAVRDKESD